MGQLSIPPLRAIIAVFCLIAVIIASWPDLVVNSASHELFTGCQTGIRNESLPATSVESEPEPVDVATTTAAAEPESAEPEPE